MKIKDITAAIEAFAPPALQESFDNTGFQVGNPNEEATGALLCVDVTNDIVDEAVARGCNLIISHHPLLFRGVKQVCGQSRVEQVLARCILNGITLYSCHTSIDNTQGGVSWRLAGILGLEDVQLLHASSPGNRAGLGVVGNLPRATTAEKFLNHIKQCLNTPMLKVSDFRSDASIARVALCGGAGGEFITDAIASGAQIYITADCKHNLFIDHSDVIILVDAGHFETEQCTKQIFFDIITEKFPNFAVCYSDIEKNPITYF